MSETITKLSETVQQIVRSRTCGCRDFYIAKITQNDATGYVAGTPVKLARAIKAKVDEKWTSEKIYSDDGTEEVINSYEGTEIELEVNALAPQDRQILFGQLYENGFLIKTADDKAPEVAVGWRERKLNGTYDFKWLYAGSLQRASVRRQAQKRANYLQQQRASRVHSMREVLTMRMRFQSTNQTL
jgi:phi13 family phage major tail protein